jgi:hypothetical protein
MNYRGDEKLPFFRVTFSIPGHVPTARSLLKSLRVLTLSYP